MNRESTIPQLISFVTDVNPPDYVVKHCKQHKVNLVYATSDHRPPQWVLRNGRRRMRTALKRRLQIAAAVKIFKTRLKVDVFILFFQINLDTSIAFAPIRVSKWAAARSESNGCRRFQKQHENGAALNCRAIGATSDPAETSCRRSYRKYLHKYFWNGTAQPERSNLLPTTRNSAFAPDR